MAACKTLPGITPTRIAQAREVRITIRGSAGVPVQVDGEAWMQAPSVITITLKNRIRVLCRDKCVAWSGLCIISVYICIF